MGAWCRGRGGTPGSGGGGRLCPPLGSLGRRPVARREEVAGGRRPRPLAAVAARGPEGRERRARARARRSRSRPLWAASLERTHPARCVRGARVGASPAAGPASPGAGRAPPHPGPSGLDNLRRPRGLICGPARAGAEALQLCCGLLDGRDAGRFNFVDKSVRWGWGGAGTGGSGGRGCCFRADLFLTRGCTSP